MKEDVHARAPKVGFIQNLSHIPVGKYPIIVPRINKLPVDIFTPRNKLDGIKSDNELYNEYM